MSLGTLLDTALRLLVRHFRLFAPLTLLGYLPMLLVAGCIGLAGMQLTGRLALVANLIGWPLCWAVTNAILQIYAADLVTGAPRTAPEVVKAAFRRLPAVLGVCLLGGLSVACGLLLLIVPGLLIYLGLSLSLQAVVLENLGPSAALSRSWQLVSRARGRTLGLTLAITAVTLAITVGWDALCLYLFPDHPANPLAFMTSLALDPLIAISYVLLYYDIRVRTEGFGLESLEGEMSA